MFVAQHTDNPAPHRDRGLEEGRNAKGLEVAFRQSARGRVLQGAVCNDRLSGGQRLKIAGTVREALHSGTEGTLRLYRHEFSPPI